MTVIASKLRGLVAEDGITLTNAFGCLPPHLPEGTWVDLFAAAGGARDAEEALAAGELTRRGRRLESAESLARRLFLPGEDGAWVEQERRHLAEVRERALSVLADACLRSGDAREAAKWAEELIALSPFAEAGYRRLMEAHVVAGNRAEALRVYEQCRQLLAEELGAYPSPETDSNFTVNSWRHRPRPFERRWSQRADGRTRQIRVLASPDGGCCRSGRSRWSSDGCGSAVRSCSSASSA